MSLLSDILLMKGSLFVFAFSTPLDIIFVLIFSDAFAFALPFASLLVSVLYSFHSFLFVGSILHYYNMFLTVWLYNCRRMFKPFSKPI